ncbi:hypothetical protein EBS02_03815 [bacterium]|nr:hypothetical protein [bacterium]
MPSSFLLPLKVPSQSKLSQFVDWFEAYHTTTNPDTGRKRKGNAKKFLLEELEHLVSTGKTSAQLSKVLEDFKKASVLSPELQKAKQTLNETDFAKLVELVEKAGVVVS